MKMRSVRRRSMRKEHEKERTWGVTAQHEDHPDFRNHGSSGVLLAKIFGNGITANKHQTQD